MGHRIGVVTNLLRSGKLRYCHFHCLYEEHRTLLVNGIQDSWLVCIRELGNLDLDHSDPVLLTTLPSSLVRDLRRPDHRRGHRCRVRRHILGLKPVITAVEGDLLGVCTETYKKDQ